MEDNISALPAQFDRRTATASFIVNLYQFYCKHGTSPNLSTPAVFAGLPAPPDHLDRDIVEESRSIAVTLALAAANRYVLPWSAEAYAEDVGGNVIIKPEHEARLMRTYPPLIDVHEVLNSTEEHLPIIDENPLVITDCDGNAVVWSLPKILSEHRQKEILKATRCLEAQLTIKSVAADDPITKAWRTGSTFFRKGVDWKAGATLLYPAGFAQGHTGTKYKPGPSTDATSERAKDWMAEFEMSGGLLDGILAVTHPELYDAALRVAAKLCMTPGHARSLMQEWPSCFSSIQVIVNRETPRHHDISGLPGWLDLLLSLGTYGENGILELRNLGVCLPYDSGTVALLNAKIILHGVPRVPGDRVCYACYMNKDVFKSMKVPFPGMSRLPIPVMSQHMDQQERDRTRAENVDGGESGDDDEDAEGSVEDVD